MIYSIPPHFWQSSFYRRQTVFYTPSTITVSESQKINGIVTCAPNAKNNRDLDIKISYQSGSEPEVNIQYKMYVCLFIVLLPPLWAQGINTRWPVVRSWFYNCQFYPIGCIAYYERTCSHIYTGTNSLCVIGYDYEAPPCHGSTNPLNRDIIFHGSRWCCRLLQSIGLGRTFAEIGRASCRERVSIDV